MRKLGDRRHAYTHPTESTCTGQHTTLESCPRTRAQEQAVLLLRPSFRRAQLLSLAARSCPIMSWIDRGLPGVGEKLAGYMPKLPAAPKQLSAIKLPPVRFYPGHALWYAIMLAWLSPVIMHSVNQRIADRKASLEQSSGQSFTFEKGEIGEAPELSVGHMRHYGQKNGHVIFGFAPLAGP